MEPRWRVQGLPSKEGSYRQLRAVADALGVEWRGAPELAVRIDGTPVLLSLDLDSGVVRGLIVKLTLEGPPGAGDEPHIELRRELPFDREGKALGIAREVQTGFAGFDHAVYIDNEASEADVHRLLAKETTRAAVLRLLESHCEGVRVAQRSITAKWKLDDEVFPAPKIVRALEELLVVSRASPPKERGARRRGKWLLGALTVYGMVSPIAALNAMFNWRTQPLLPVLGAAAGLVLGLLARPLLVRAMAGDAGSFVRYRFSVFLAVLGTAWFVPGSLVALNGALDTSKPVMRSGTIVELGTVDDEKALRTVTVQWSDGLQSDETFGLPVSTGAPVAQEQHDGALGFEWHRKARRGR